VGADVVAAALAASGVSDPAPGAQHAFETGMVTAYPQERLFGHPRWADLEERFADEVVRLVTGGEEGAVSVVTAPRDTDPRPLVQPVVEAMEKAGARVARTRGDRVPAQLTVLAEADLVVVGRADLLGLEVAVQLAEALRDGSRLILVGDPQLPAAAGPGRVLADLVESAAVPVLPAPELPGDLSPLAHLVRSVRGGRLPQLDPAQREVVVTPAGDAGQAVRRAVQLVTTSVPRVFGIEPPETLVLAPRSEGSTGTAALQQALGEAGAGAVPCSTCAAAVGRRADAVVLVLGAEAQGSLSRDLLLGAATEARRHLSIVHQAGSALVEAVERRAHRPRQTQLAGLLAALLTDSPD
jgi:ATP-dependent exoDNAse (exonuclease V) alpha subunit